MILKFLQGKVELLSTFNREVYYRTTQKLKQNGIACWGECLNTGSGNNRSCFLGSIGENPDYQIQYRIFVKKKDLERAAHL